MRHRFPTASLFLFLVGLMACGGSASGPDLERDDRELAGADPGPAMQDPADQDAIEDTDEGEAAVGDVVPPPQTVLPPTRLVLVSTSHGAYRSDCFSRLGSDALTLGPALAPLEPHKARLLVVDGLVGPAEDTGAHGWGPAHAFTGSATLLPGGGPLISRYRSTRASTDAFLPSSEMRHLVTSAPRYDMQFTPSSARLATGEQAAPRVLATAQGLRDLAESLFASASDPAAEELFTWLFSSELDSEADRARAHGRIIALALQLGLTRAAVMHASNVLETFPSAGGPVTYNELAHLAVDDAAVRDDFVSARATVAARVAALLVALAEATAEDGSSLLEHTLVVWVDDTGWSDASGASVAPVAHSRYGLPVLVFASPRFGLTSSHYIDANRPYGEMLATIAVAVGIDAEDLGASLSTAPLIESLFD